MDLAWFLLRPDEHSNHRPSLQDVEHTMDHMEKAKSNYIWDYFKNVEGHRKHRLSALKDCTDDMRESSERFVQVTLPSLLFMDGEFDILLSAHF